MARSAPNTTGNNLAPNVVTLPSSAGFNAGDLVYYKDGDYRALPSNALTAATFDVTQSLPTFRPPIGSNITSSLPFAGGSKGECVAVLSNGNIVTVYFKSANDRPAFFIATPAGATVVAETEVSTVFTSSQPAIGVAALSGGGFVVYWLNTSGGATYNPCYAIYNNAGVVVTAAAQDSGAGAASSSGAYIAGVALPNGGFALSFIVATGTIVYTRAYNATGVASFAWVNVGAVVVNVLQRISMAARSDSSYIIVYTQAQNAVFRYTVFSAAGAVLTTSTFTSATSSSYPEAPVSATVLNDGTTFVIGYSVYNGSGAGYFYGYRFLPSSYVISAENLIPAANTHALTDTTRSGRTLSVKSLAAGGFIFVFVDPSGAIYYLFFDNAGNPVSGTNLSGAIVFPIPGSFHAYSYKNITLVEYNGNMNLFWGVGDANSRQFTILTSAINTTTYQLVNYQSVTDSLGTVSAPVSGLANTTTPGAARFLASASSTQILNNSLGFTINPSVVAPVACDGVHVVSRTDGGFIIIYRSRAANRPITAVVYNRFGGVVQTIPIGDGFTSCTARPVAATVLTNNALVVAFHIASSTVKINVYSLVGNNYSLSATTTRTGFVGGTTEELRFNLAALSNNRFVIAYPTNSSTGSFIVFSNSLSVLAGPTSFVGSNPYDVSISALNGSGFGIYWRTSGTNYSISSFAESSTNTFSNIAGTTFGSTTTGGGTTNMVVTPGNVLAVTAGITTSTAVYLYSYDSNAGVAGANQQFTGVTKFEAASCVGVTGTGALVMFFASSFSATSGRAIAYNAGLNGVNPTPPTTGISVFSFTNCSVSSSGGNGQICTSSAAGDNCLFAWLDANNFPTYAMLYSYPSTVTTSIASGVTASALQPITPYSNQSLNGYVLQGVALTSAPAGGTGQVQTNGIARLNSNYSTGTPASSFDFQTPNGTNIPGVKGTAIGNTVILEGRS